MASGNSVEKIIEIVTVISKELEIMKKLIYKICNFLVKTANYTQTRVYITKGLHKFTQFDTKTNRDAFGDDQKSLAWQPTNLLPPVITIST